MQVDTDIAELVRSAAATALRQASIEQISVTPDVGHDGQDALRITIMVTPEAAITLSGDEIIDALVAIHDRLKIAGEQRRPMVDYTTRDEAEAGDDLEF